ncbi:reverse transcriptase domain-containing protein [Tanacetum coccineum]|uniref:Reverse transcriptase domain-containing protein n=1 Tax=Tanacetum coccineum TaxID=301880 RepID=A0ABQ5HZH9_9ASTR
MSDMTACLNDLSYIPLNNEQNEPTQGDIGETSNDPTQAKRNEFEELYASANEELYPGCDHVTRLDFMAKFTYFKVKGKLKDSIFNEMLEFFQNVFPTAKGYKLPPSYYAIKKTFKTIGLGYESIHACVNDCFLFWGDANKDVHFCPVCNTSRWKDSNTPGKKVPKKVLRYFPIIPRLQRLYKSSHTAKEMTWHATGKCTEPGKMQHPVDGRAWKDFDTKYSDFAAEPRNVRLGLAADGFNPFGNLSQSYSMWPVILTTYNLPPWLCMKESSFMLTLLIPVPKSLGKDIDVYLRPLIDDLKQICSQTLIVDDMLKAQSKVIDILCNLELIYPLAFFDIMIHLVIHLPLEAIFGGPIRPRWMYPFERYMKKLKNYVRNKAKPEGSIAEGYVAEEALTFSSHYFRDVTTKFNRPDRNVDCPPPTCQFQVFKSLCKSIGLRSVIRIDHQELKKVICEFPNKDMKEEFPGWFGKQIRQRHVDNDPGVNESSELFALACGPSQTPISVNSCVVNGVRFVVHSRDERRTTQNSGICSPGPDGEMYYGQLEQILEFSYLSFKTVLFRVKWFDTSNKGRIQNFVIRNNITQIKANGEAFKNDQYILATQVKQCFYLEDMARRPLGWKVVEHVSHKKFLNGGVIVVEDDPDVIHVDNSSDLALSTSLNDLEIAALHIDGQSIDVDAPPDIIDVVDEDDDIIDEEDPIPHDLADSDDEDLVNLDIDDGVNVMSADVARRHDSDGGGDDHPPPYQVPTGCGGYLGNRGKGTRKPNLGGRRAGKLHTRQETQNLRLKAITDKSGPILIRFEVNDRETLMPLGDHAAHWANYLGELVRELPLHYPSWRQMPPERKAGVVAKIGTQFDLRPHMESDRWPQIYAGIQQHLQKIYNGKKAALKERYWVPEEDGTYDLERLRRGRPSYISEVDWDAQLAFWNDPKNLARAAQNKQNRAKSKVMETLATREYPSLIHTFFLTHTIGGVFLNPEDKALYDEMLRLQGLGSNTPMGVPYTEDEIMVIVRWGKQRGHIPGSKRGYADYEKKCKCYEVLFRSDDKFSQIRNQLESQPEYGGGSGSGGCGDDELGDDEDDDKDEEDDDNS